MPDSKKQYIEIDGLSCGSCVRKAETAMLTVKGVKKAQINFADRTALVEGDFAQEDVLSVLKKAGYKGTLLNGLGHKPEEKGFWELLHSVPALVLALWLMGLMHTYGMPKAPYSALWHAVNWFSLGAMVFAGLDIYARFFASLRRVQPDMYTLIGFGTWAAWGYSCFVLYFPELLPQEEARHFHYEAGLFIIAFINIGHFLEARIRGRAGRAIEKLMALVPKKAVRVRNGQEETVALEVVEVGDLLRVRPGDSIPVDGRLEEGSGMVSEAMLTGEPILVNKSVGDVVIGGTENRNGSFLMRAEKVGQETVLAAITTMVRQAQATKPAIARVVDQVAGVFTFAVLLIALLAGVLWWMYGPEPRVLYVFMVVMTIFVIACPCALGLATPVSVMAGVGRAAKFGILFPKGDALGRLGMADVVVFDKTGTLTKGAPRVVDVLSTEGQNTERVLQLAASLASQATHPLSAAIVAEAKHKEAKLLKVNKLEEQPGLGLKANIGGKTYFLGSQKLLVQEKISFENLRHEAESLISQGKTIVFIAGEDGGIGLLALRDDLRTEAAQAIAALHKQGLKTIMLTGDNAIAAKAIADIAGINIVVAEQKPEDKLTYIKNLQHQGHAVAMVGDGVNDAPALAQADVGISLASASDIALGTADVVIATEDLRRLSLAVKVSRATVRNIKQNLFWAFLYNSAALPIAAGLLFPVFGVLLPPWVAGAAMAFSSLTVVLNAARLSLLRK